MKLEAKLKWNFINNSVMVLLCRNPLCGPSCHAKLLSDTGSGILCGDNRGVVLFTPTLSSVLS